MSQPQCGEVSECFALEHATQVSLDIGRARQAGIVADEAKPGAVRAQAPQRTVVRVEPVLEGRRGRSSPAIDGQMRAGTVEIVRWRHDDDRHAAIEPFERHRKLLVAGGVGANTMQIRKAEDVAQELLNKTSCAGQ